MSPKQRTAQKRPLLWPTGADELGSGGFAESAKRQRHIRKIGLVRSFQRWISYAGTEDHEARNQQFDPNHGDCFVHAAEQIVKACSENRGPGGSMRAVSAIWYDYTLSIIRVAVFLVV